VAVALALSACAPPKKPVAVPAGPTATERLAAADALVRTGCFDCLADALHEYESIRVASSIAPASVEAATLGAIRTAILLDLRERELGTTDDHYLARARELLQGRAGLAEAFAPAIDLTETISWRIADTRDAGDDAQLNAVRRLAQNREAWKTLFHDRAGEHPFWAYLWLSFACSTGETRSLTPGELVAPFAALGDASLLSYKATACPGTSGVPPRRSAIDVDGLTKLRQAEPRFNEIDYQLAIHLMFFGKVEEANELMERAYRWHPKWPAVTMSLASLALTSEDFERALGFYDATLALIPGQRDAMLGRVKTLSYLGRNEEAIQVVDVILQGRWNRGEAYYWRAWNNMQLTRNDQAWIDVEAAWKLYITSDVAKLAGMIAYRRQEIDVARQKFEEGHRMNESDCELGYYLGLVNAEQRRWPPTAEVFISTASCLQNAQRAYTDEITQIQASTGSPERKARQIARREKLIQDAERMIVTSWFNTAVAYYNLSRTGDARQYAEKVVADQQFGERARDILSRLNK
jgi:tetratricopeptide (TPR) repeat protein